MTVLFGKKLNQCGGVNGAYMHMCPACDQPHVYNTISTPEHPCLAWEFNRSPEAPTFSPSMLIRYNRPKGYTRDNPAPVGWKGEREQVVCHYFVTDGKISYCSDSTHALAGQTVDLPDYPVRDQSDSDE